MKQLLLLTAALGLVACADTAATEAAPAEQAATEASAPAPESSITTEDLGNGFYMLVGNGGNIGVSVGDDGVYMIDDKFSRNADDILAAIAAISDKPLRYVHNTHLHGDHSGSNPEMKAAGAVITAHDNVRKRMGMSYESLAFGRTVEAKSESFWPVLTFSDTQTLHFNGQTVRAIHIPNAHTDGDSIVHFVEGNVIHMGDNYFAGRFPFVDVDSGGTLSGMIAAQAKGLSLANANTQIIPGHGPLASKSDLQAMHDMLVDLRDRVQTAKRSGTTLEAYIASEPLADLSDFSWNFITEERILTAAWRSLD